MSVNESVAQPAPLEEALGGEKKFLDELIQNVAAMDIAYEEKRAKFQVPEARAVEIMSHSAEVAGVPFNVSNPHEFLDMVTQMPKEALDKMGLGGLHGLELSQIPGTQDLFSRMYQQASAARQWVVAKSAENTGDYEMSRLVPEVSHIIFGADHFIELYEQNEWAFNDECLHLTHLGIKLRQHGGDASVEKAKELIANAVATATNSGVKNSQWGADQLIKFLQI